MINDNDPNGPEREVIKTESMSKSISDREPYQEKVFLSCGHWCFNTFGDRCRRKQLGEKLKCFFCGQ